ncbi:MAG: [FeFe] hydrogenase H-cluster radical SAM maturase HydE [Peptococcaceae bacterium]
MSAVMPEALNKAAQGEKLLREDILSLLNLKPEEDPMLFKLADQVRQQYMGDEVHLRGIIEFSNYCAKNCLYCGLRRDNQKLDRYRLSDEEIIEAGNQAAKLGLKTIVLQSGEDLFYTGERLAKIIACLKAETGVAVTVSVGDRSKEDYRLMKQAGADRYLLKHETAGANLFSRLRPGTTLAGRIKRLYWLKELGFQVGAGNMVGLPGQTYETLVDDILLLRELDVEMAGIGPFIPHHQTPLKNCVGGEVKTTLKVLAVTRLILPLTHLPATTALASIHPQGRQMALSCGANVVMPNVTPVKYRERYQIYPNKICLTEETTETVANILNIIQQLGRRVAQDYGHSPKYKERMNNSES